MAHVTQIPNRPKIYHITHMDNLPVIVEHGCLWSDARRVTEDCSCTVIGMSQIKQRRLEDIEVSCHKGTRVGEYVPFYFCPRSIMLYILHKGNHVDLDYHGGQSPIIHLQADLRRVIAWADGEGRPWAFSDCNAGAYYASFYGDLSKLEIIDWDAVAARDWRDLRIKEGKQAEFLVWDSFPWELVEKVGVIDARTLADLRSILGKAEHKPLARVQRGWYY